MINTTYVSIQENGHVFTLPGGNKKTLFGALAAISADNLGSLAIGGFKESCSAIKMCRQCMADHDTAKELVNYTTSC